MGTGFVFLHRAGKRTTWQLQQALQAGAIVPENAGLRFG